MDISLGPGTGGALVVLQATQASRAEAEARLASGLRVATPLDGATAFFGASSLRARAEAFDATLDRIGLAKSGLEASLRGLESGRKLLTQLRAQVAGFAKYLPDDAVYETVAELRDGLSADTDVGTLNDDPYTAFPLPNGRNFQLRLEDRTGTLLERAVFRYDSAGPIPVDNPGASPPRYNFRTVGQLVADINASALGVTASLENGQLRIVADDPAHAIRFTGSRDVLEALHMRVDRLWADQRTPSDAAPAVIRGVSGVTEATDIASLAGGIANNRNIRFFLPSEESARGYTEATFRYRTDGRSDRGGRTVGDFIRFINDRVPELSARLDKGQLVVEGDARGIYVQGNAPMENALGLARGTHWGGVEAAPKRLVGAVSGLGPGTDAAGNMGFISDGQGGQVRFRYGTGAGRDGTTLGDFVKTINDAEAAGTVKLRAGFTEEGRLYLESTGGTNVLPALPGARPLRVAGLAFNRVWGAPGSEPFVLPAASNGVTEAQWRDFQAIGDVVSQYDSLLRDAGLAGRNAATGEPTRLVVNDRATRLAIGRTLGALSRQLGLEEIRIFDLLDRRSLDRTLTDLTEALDTIEARVQHLTNDLAALSVREDFNAGLRDTLRDGADALTLADTDEAGARTLAARTRETLAFEALTLIAQSQRGVLRLF